MPKYIVKLKDLYFEYSTVVDAPTTSGMALADFKAYYRREYGNSGMKRLPKLLEMVHKGGTSCPYGDGMEDTDNLMWFNRAGPNEKRLTIDEIYELIKPKEPTCICMRSDLT